MKSLFGPKYESMPVRQGDLPVPLSSALQAGAEEGFAQTTQQVFLFDPFVSAKKSGVLVSKKDALERGNKEGIVLNNIPDSGLDEAILDHKIRSIKRQQRNQDIYDRSSGFGKTLYFGSMFGSALTDVVNLVPGFGQEIIASKFAEQAARMATTRGGRAALRAAEGAIDVGVATAAVEPGYSYLRNMYGGDYTFQDSLANVFMAPLIGGTFKAGGGAIADALKWKTSVYNYIDPNITKEVLPAAANKFLTTGDIRNVRTLEAAMLRQYGLPLKDITPGNLERIFKDGPDVFYKDQAIAEYSRLNPDLDRRFTELKDTVSSFEKSRALRDYADLITSKKPDEIKRVEILVQKFGKAQLDDYVEYKNLRDSVDSVNGKRKSKSLTNRIDLINKRSSGLFSDIYEGKVKYDKKIEQEYSQLGAIRKSDILNLQYDIKQKKYLEYMKLYEDAKRSELFPLLGKLDTEQENKIDEILSRNKEYADGDNMDTIKQEIDYLKEYEKDFSSRYNMDVKEEPELDITRLSENVKRYLNCLVR